MRFFYIVLIALLLCMTACAAVDAPAETTPSPTVAVTPVPSPTPTPMPTPSPSPSPTRSPRPTRTPRRTPKPLPSVETVLSGIALSEHAEPIGEADMAIGSFTLDSTPDDFRAAFGEPTDTVFNDQYAIANALTYTYPSGEIKFLEDGDGTYSLHHISFTGGDMRTPRGIGIGSSIQDVFSAYVDQIEYIGKSDAFFYRYNTGSDIEEAIPPSGVIWPNYDRDLGRYDGWSINFSIPSSLDQYEGYTMEELIDSYIYCWFYTLSFTVRDGIVTEIGLFSGPFGE